MDTSETYIKMCEKAEELNEYERSEHSFFVCGEHHLDMTHDADEYFQHLIKNKEKCIWLPRQDQLQEMVGGWKRCDIPRWHAIDFAHFVTTSSAPTNKDASMEQLWLAFVMKEKYDKTWDGENWEKQ